MTHHYARRTPDDKPIPRWLDAAEFARRAGISERAAREAMKAAALGQRWRNAVLTVRAVPGAGGPGGLKRQVLETSIPTEPSGPSMAQIVHVDRATRMHAPEPAAAEWSERLKTIGAALEAPRGSKQRAALIEQASQLHGVSPWTLRKWIAEYERRGLAALRRNPRSDRGRSRVLISRDWDAAVTLPEHVKTDIAEKTRRDVASLWAGGASGWRHVVKMASATLISRTHEASPDIPEPTLRLICKLPRPFVERQRGFQIIATKDKDAKRFFDVQQPRVHRTTDGMAPMEIVAADVHHADVLWRRPDGSLCTPKLISWLDIRTGRLTASMVLCAPGEMVRQEHVVASFIEVTQHPEWGLPRVLYLDNGGEFEKLGFASDAMKLGELVHSQEMPGRASMIIKARPYNAPAKPIEGIFGVLERGAFAMLPGFIGGNRMRKKTQNVGAEPMPFPGDEMKLRSDLRTALDYYNSSPQSGHLRGKSPNEVFRHAVASGWRRVDIDGDALSSVFAREITRTVKQGEFTIDNKPYRHDKLLGLIAGTKVLVRVPVIGDRSRLAVWDTERKFICMAEPAPFYTYLDATGAKDQNARSRSLTQQISLMRDDVDPVDLVARMREATLAPAPLPIESLGTVRLAPEHEAVAVALRANPAQQRARDAEARRREREAQSTTTKKLIAARRRASG